MSKLVVVSNRLPLMPEKKKTASRSELVGGLVSALLSALDVSGGGIWFGWSGKTGKTPESAPSESWKLNRNRIVGFHLTKQEVDAYYNGFCNRALWPLLHSFQGRVRISRAENESYAKVNTRFAELLLPFLDPDDSVWVNDYHLFHMGRELRRMGYAGLIGFFLHVPFPSYDIWQILPNPKKFLAGIFDYDLVGFHTRTYRDNYVYTCQRLCGASWDGATLKVEGRKQRVGVFPIGVDPRMFARPDGQKRRPGSLRDTGIRRIILGVDRLDYTKGIPHRIQAFEALLKNYPQYRGQVSLVQICAPSRTRVPEYIEQQQMVESLVGHVNGAYAEHNWVPIRYLYRTYPHERLRVFYRESDVGLVTPLRDGLNLVAKEFIAAQDPEDPGVLVLSRFAGAAEELTDAVLVNPYLLEDAAEGIHTALSMTREERVARHKNLFEIVSRRSVDWWFKTFLENLAAARR